MGSMTASPGIARMAEVGSGAQEWEAAKQIDLSRVGPVTFSRVDMVPGGENSYWEHVLPDGVRLVVRSEGGALPTLDTPHCEVEAFGQFDRAANVQPVRVRRMDSDPNATEVRVVAQGRFLLCLPPRPSLRFGEAEIPTIAAVSVMRAEGATPRSQRTALLGDVLQLNTVQALVGLNGLFP